MKLAAAGSSRNPQPSNIAPNVATVEAPTTVTQIRQLARSRTL
jgi:hypothetical protein